MHLHGVNGKMGIAQVCPMYYPDIGDVETHVKKIGEGLVKRDFEAEVLRVAYYFLGRT